MMCLGGPKARSQWVKADWNEPATCLLHRYIDESLMMMYALGHVCNERSDFRSLLQPELASVEQSVT